MCRYAITVWYMDTEERREHEARLRGGKESLVSEGEHKVEKEKGKGKKSSEGGREVQAKENGKLS